MKKIYLQSLFLLMATFAFAQTDVVVSIDINAGSDITNVMIKGTASGWADLQAFDDGTNGDATSADGIWTTTFVDVACDGTTHEWGAVDQNGTWLLAPGEPNRMFTVDATCAVTGDLMYTIPSVGSSVDLLLTVTDPNMDIGGISIKGAYGGWSSEVANDDGIDGDVAAGDGIWSIMVSADAPLSGADPITYEWGAERTDCASPAWIIQGANRVFTVDDSGAVAGELDYMVPALGTTYDVTFLVYMGNEIVSSDGIFVSGEFETCPWSKQDIQLTQSTVDPDVYEATYAITPGVFRWKFFNGSPGLDDGGENQGGTSTATVFQDNGCGVDNGFGGSNREIDLSTITENTVLPAFIFDSCDEYEIVSAKEVLNLERFNITPNPVNSQALIQFSNDANEAFQLTITSVAGQLIQTLSNITSNEVSISVDNMNAGMYFVTLQNETGATTSRKFVVR